MVEQSKPKELPSGHRLTNIRRSLTVVGVIAVTVIAYAAYRFFTNRTGEAAVALIPADATFVTTFDGTPSPGQVLAFAKISQALNSEGVSESAASYLGKAFANNSFAKDVEPYVTKNLAEAMWKTKDFEAAAYFAITDAGKVQAALSKDCPNSPESGVYSLPSGNGCVLGVIGNYLVIASNQPRFDQIVKVSKGLLPSVATLNAYKTARAALPADSNLMVFVTPQIYAMAGQKAPSEAWFSLGAAVRDDGLAIACRYPGGKETLGVSPAFDQTALKALPSGAFGVLAYSDPSVWYQAMKRQGGKAMAPMLKVADEMKSKTGVSVEGDILPALQGNFEVAIYPGPKMEPTFLAYCDSEHNADPVAFVQKVRSSMSAHEAAWGNMTVTESKQGEATIYRVQDPQKTQPASMPQSSSDLNHANVVLLNNAVYITTSDEMVSKVVGLGQGGQSLAQDPPFISMKNGLAPNSQSVLMVSLYRIMNTLNHGAGADASINTIFGGANSGLVGSGHYNANTGVGDLFIPLDWGKAIHWLGKTMKSAAGGPAMPHTSSAGMS